MRVEEHEKVVKQFIRAINSGQFELLEDLVHDEIGWSDRKDFIERTLAGTNPVVEFYKLLGYDHKTIEGFRSTALSIENKLTFINYHKWIAKYYSNHEIQDIVCGEKRIWAIVNSKFVMSNQRKLDIRGFWLIDLKDSKIVALGIIPLYLGSLMQVGKMIFESSDKQEIENYLQVLGNMGILPQEF